MIDRRQFLTGTILAGATAAASCSADDTGVVEETPPVTTDLRSSDGEWNNVRRQFSLAREPIDMSAMLIASHPEPVRKAIERHRNSLDARPTEYLQEVIDDNERRVLTAAADYLGSSAREIALTDSTTMGLGLVYNGIRISEGQEFLTTEQNYYSTDESIRLRALRSGASVRRIPLFEDLSSVTADQLATTLLDAVSPATRVVALTWVHSSTGLKLPIRRIADGIAALNEGRPEEERILLAVDGVHGFGVENVEMADLGCDYFIAGCHKWLFGPRGTGIVWASPRGWQNIEATIPTFIDDSIRNAWAVGASIPDDMDGLRFTPGGFKAFEHQWAMAEAFDFHLRIGKEKIAARTHELAQRLKKGLASIEHVTLQTPMSEELSSGIVCFEVDGISARGVVNRLAERNVIATVTPYLRSFPRLTPSIRNTAAEVDAAIAAVADIR